MNVKFLLVSLLYPCIFQKSMVGTYNVVQAAPSILNGFARARARAKERNHMKLRMKNSGRQKKNLREGKGDRFHKKIII